jgi:hypothetical protein
LIRSGWFWKLCKFIGARHAEFIHKKHPDFGKKENPDLEWYIESLLDEQQQHVMMSF